MCEDVGDSYAGSMHSFDAKERIRSWAMLVIDEASMLSGEFFDQVISQGCQKGWRPATLYIYISAVQ